MFGFHKLCSTIIFFIVITQVLTAPSDWKCGTAGTEDLSYNIVKFECPSAVGSIGSCCATHDTCYDMQRGRDNCDNEFCACMTSTMNMFNCRGATVQNFCSLVKFNGGFAYGMAGLKRNGR